MRQFFCNMFKIHKWSHSLNSVGSFRYCVKCKRLEVNCSFSFEIIPSYVHSYRTFKHLKEHHSYIKFEHELNEIDKILHGIEV